MENPKKLHELAQPIFTVEVYVMYGEEVLMFKRSETKKKFPGFWSLPGGHIDEGEDPVSAAIREIKEETGIVLTAEQMKLKVLAMHHHIDRGELYVAFAFVAQLDKKMLPEVDSEEGTAHWVKKAEMLTKENVFEPIKYYFSHVLGDRPGLMYNMSEWKETKLVRVLSESVC